MDLFGDGKEKLSANYLSVDPLNTEYTKLPSLMTMATFYIYNDITLSVSVDQGPFTCEANVITATLRKLMKMFFTHTDLLIELETT